MVAEHQRCAVTAQYLVDLMSAYMRGGMRAGEAAARVIEDVRAAEEQDAFIDALGPRAVVDLWARMKSPTPTPITTQPAQQPRRVDVEKLKESTSLLEGMHQIGGRWVRLGDMDIPLCRAAAQQFKATALESAHTSRYFHALAKALDGGEKVRQRFDDAALLRIWDTAGRDG